MKILSTIGLTSFVSTLAIQAAEDGSFFESRIRPVLVEHCYKCHSAETGKSKGGLTLDSRQGLKRGGDSGPVIVAGQAGQSLLLKALSHADPDLAMPPDQPPLSRKIQTDFEHWINQGAHDPRQDSTVAETMPSAPALKVTEARKFWAYRKPVEPGPPAVQDVGWPRKPLDRFILARLEKEGLSPSPDTAPALLLRRLYFDLTGLPPNPQTVRAFSQAWAESTDRESLLAATVDDLLASPRFGERWARHWLDVARFAESNGRESNLVFPHAWRYRDYVIDAFNDDLPFDRFIAEQLAGDLLPASAPEERARLLIATGFLAFGAKGLNEMNPAQFEADLADEQMDTVARAFMGASVACARCHDHKSEPFTMRDYYALAGIFKSTRTHYGTWIDSENNNGSTLIRLPKHPGQLIQGKSLPKDRVQKLKDDRARLDREEREQNEFLKKAQQEGRDISSEGFKLLQNAIRIYWSRGGIDGQLMTVDEQGHALPLCMGVEEAKSVTDAALLNRGELSQPGDRIARRFPQVFEIAAADPPKEQSGRLELARWLGHPDHPLTSRVLANRIWLHLMGAGLVSTPDTFGFSGSPPSHPELLDALALKLVREKWSVKSLIREVVLSRTYRQSSRHRADCFEKDPDNRLLWRANGRRLDAEALRDAMLAVSGELDVSRRPGSLVTEFSGQSVSLVAFNSALPADLDGSVRRSIYLPVLRDQQPDILELFDAADPALVTGKREVTNVPLQALYLMNSPWIRARAAALAAKAAEQSPRLEEQMAAAFQSVLCRPPDKAEKQFMQQFVTATTEDTRPLELFCHSLLASAEFRQRD